jgi:hypothetical protein
MTGVQATASGSGASAIQLTTGRALAAMEAVLREWPQLSNDQVERAGLPRLPRHLASGLKTFSRSKGRSEGGAHVAAGRTTTLKSPAR